MIVHSSLMCVGVYVAWIPHHQQILPHQRVHTFLTYLPGDSIRPHRLESLVLQECPQPTQTLIDSLGHHLYFD